MYDANGNKLRKTVGAVSQDYLGGIEYNGGVVEAVYHEEGRATLSGTSWQYEYYLKDHLGNTRVVFSDTNNDDIPEILQEADYYPFGMRHQNATATNHYLYNGKELNTDLGLDWYDYGFRWYDAELGRFPSVDPIIENFPDLTPYNYASNNPSTLIDLWGLQGVYPNPAYPTQYLDASLSAFGKQFKDARASTKRGTTTEVGTEKIHEHKEYGFGIFTDGNNVYITDIIKGHGNIVNVPGSIIDLKNKNQGTGPVALTSQDGTKTFYDSSIHFFVGIYHTHPDIGKDGDPLSTGDIYSYLRRYETGVDYITQNGTGFFIIADDINGGRYAIVTEDENRASMYHHIVYPLFEKKTRIDGNREVTYQEATAFLRGEGPIGPITRNFYSEVFYQGSGIGIYYNQTYSSTLGRLNSNRRFYFPPLLELNRIDITKTRIR